MAIKALNPMAAFWFTPESENGEDNPTEFEICGLNGAQMAQVAPGIHIANDDFSIDSKAMKLTLGFGLRGWRNFDNDQGPVKFFKNPEKNMEVLPYEIQIELAGAIFNASNVDEEERKN